MEIKTKEINPYKKIWQGVQFDCITKNIRNSHLIEICREKSQGKLEKIRSFKAKAPTLNRLFHSQNSASHLRLLPLPTRKDSEFKRKRPSRS